MPSGPLWHCPRCGRTFANVNQTHTCRPPGAVDDHFAGKDPQVRAIFDRIIEVVSTLGPVTILPQRTRIALHVRMSFAAFTPRLHWLDGHLVLARRVPLPRFRRIEVYSAHNVLHTLRLRSVSEVDPELETLLAEAYRVGEQRHIRSR